MSYPLRRPDPPATFSTKDFAGEVVLTVIGGYHPEVKTREYGIKPAERVSIVMLTGRTAGTIYEDVMLFGAKQSSQFRDMKAGDVVLCRIVKNGNAVSFEPGSAYDEQQAGAWIDANAGRLEQLRDDTARNFDEQVRRLRDEDDSPPSRPQSSPQFTPPAQSTADGNGATTGRLVATPFSEIERAPQANATLASLRDPATVEQASPHETGY